jgi:hypothetical protein
MGLQHSRPIFINHGGYVWFGVGMIADWPAFLGILGCAPCIVRLGLMLDECPHSVQRENAAMNLAGGVGQACSSGCHHYGHVAAQVWGGILRRLWQSSLLSNRLQQPFMQHSPISLEVLVGQSHQPLTNRLLFTPEKAPRCYSELLNWSVVAACSPSTPMAPTSGFQQPGGVV